MQAYSIYVSTKVNAVKKKDFSECLMRVADNNCDRVIILYSKTCNVVNTHHIHANSPG